MMKRDDSEMDRKKILITGSTFPRWENDTEPRFILDYAKAMKKYYDVTVLVPYAIGAKESENMEGVKVIRYHYFPIHKFETLCYPGAIVPRIREKKIRILLVPFLLVSLFFNMNRIYTSYDLVHAHWIIPQGIIQSNMKKVPYILTGHGGDVSSLNNWPISVLKRRALKFSKHTTVVSENLYEIVQNIYPCPEMSIIPMGCDTSSFNNNLRIENYFGQNNKKVVLFVGRLAEKKGCLYLIKAMREVKDAILVIVGKGNLEDELRVEAKDIQDKVVFLGAKTHKELPRIYASADVFVAPSITAKDGDKEGFGLVILEAMASGIPVIASNSGGIIDIVQNGVNGLLVEEKDVNGISSQINTILNEPQLRKQLVNNAFNTVKEFSYENVAAKYASIISSII